MLRADFIRPMRLKPAKTDDKPIFILVEEDCKKILKGTVIPTTTSGQYNGIMPINNTHYRSQPQLILKSEEAVTKVEKISAGSSEKVPGLQPVAADIGVHRQPKSPDIHQQAASHRVLSMHPGVHPKQQQEHTAAARSLESAGANPTREHIATAARIHGLSKSAQVINELIASLRK
jgi:hypothetical protein